MMIEIRVDNQGDEDAVVALVKDGSLSELLGRPFVVRSEVDGEAQTIAGGFTKDTYCHISYHMVDGPDDIDGEAGEVVSAPGQCPSCNDTGKIVKMYEDSPAEPWRPGSYADGVVRPCPDARHLRDLITALKDELAEYYGRNRELRARVKEMEAGHGGADRR